MAELVKHHRIRCNSLKTLTCHRCSNPLNLKQNCFKRVEDEIFDELNSDRYSAVNAEKDYRNVVLPIINRKFQSSVMRKVVLPINIPDITNDFMIIGELSSLPLKNTSLRVTNVLYDLMSEDVSIDHPMCLECTDSILDQMDSQLEGIKEEHKAYQVFLGDCQDHLSSDEDDLEELEEELKKLKVKEVILETKVQECESEVINVKKVLKTCEEEFNHLETKEKEQWIKPCFLKRKLLSMEDDRRSVNNQLMYAQAQYKLAKTDIFSAAFHIWHSGCFGTINNLRLGRLPTVPVEWTEINAAWGQTVLLLHSLAETINLTFERYKLVPYGCRSYIIPWDNKAKILPLYSFGEIKFVFDHGFDHAMVAFLDCLQQLKKRVEDSGSSYYLPYKIYKGKIEDPSVGKSYSIKRHLNSQEQWTKALKFMLTNLKWAIAWVSTKFKEND